MKLPGHIAKRVRALLEEVNGAVLPWSAPAVLEAGKLLPYFQGTRRKPPSKLSKSLQSRRPAKAKIHKENQRALRAAVMERAGAMCEVRHLRDANHFRFGLEMDHWLGGSGRRRQLQSVETCWILCTMCSRDRTENRPTAQHWNNIRRQFCASYGYPFTPHIDKGPARSAPKSLNSLAIKDTQS